MSALKKGWQYELVSDVLILFRFRGRVWEGVWWMATGSEPFKESKPFDFLHELESSIIRSEIQSATGIHRIVISPRIAMMLYLEGVLTLEALEQAEEGMDTIIVTLFLADEERRVVIKNNSKPELIAYDEMGKSILK
jgi:hypothetical protein